MTLATPLPLETATPVNPSAARSAIRSVLHVGCGAADPAKLPQAFFPAGAWSELRLDIDQ